MIVTPWTVMTAAAISLAIGCWGMCTLSGEYRRVRDLEESMGTSGKGRPSSVSGRLGRKLQNAPWMTDMRNKLTAAGLQWPVERVLLAVVTIFILVLTGGQFLVGRIASVVLALTFPLVFLRWLDHRRLKRTQRFVAQLPELARLLANGSSAGLSMRRCLGMASTELLSPACEEIGSVVTQLDIGWPVEQALQKLSERLPSREVGVLIRTIVIQQRAGGELVRALNDIAASLEDRKELRREVGTTVLGASVSGYAVILIGLGAVLLMNIAKPGILDLMASSFLGQIALVVAGVLFIGGVVMMRLVSRVEI